MIAALRDRLCRLLKVPPEPEPPRGSSESLRVFRAGRGFLRYRLLELLVAGLLAVALYVTVGVALRIGLQNNPPEPAWIEPVVWSVYGVVGLLVGLRLLLGFVTLRLDYDMRWYIVTDRALRIREGLWTVHEMTMTLANIQNVELSQGPLQRLFGITDLVVQSAGGGGASVQEQRRARTGATNMHRGSFRGIDKAEAIRDLVVARMRKAKGGGLGDEATHELPAAAQTGLALSSRAQSVLGAMRDEARALRQVADRL